jgi:hypothetical protein
VLALPAPKCRVPLSKTVIHKLLGQRSAVYVSGRKCHLRRLVIYTFPGILLPPKGASCIAPLNLWRHYRCAFVRRKPFVQGLSESRWCQG